jgi:hypothetical protein
MKGNRMSKAASIERPDLTEEQLAQLRAARNHDPDTSDIPEAPAETWRYARCFHKPRKPASTP